MNINAMRKNMTSVGLGVVALLSAGILTACDRHGDMTTASSASASQFPDSPERSADAGRTATEGEGAATASGVSPTPPFTTADRGTGLQDPGTLTENNPTSARPAAVSDADKAFIRDAGQSGLFEVQVAQLAVAKANDSAVKSFASMLLQDHQDANGKLKQVANQLNVDLPTAVAPDQKKTLDDLQKATGADFDKKFVQAVGVQDHKKDIALFEKVSRDANDPGVRDFARTTLPTLKAHLTTAQKLPIKG